MGSHPKQGTLHKESLLQQSARWLMENQLSGFSYKRGEMKWIKRLRIFVLLPRPPPAF